jgi:hypothetical protein
MILELNARPGLAIQMANGNGLLHRLHKVEELQSTVSSTGRCAPVRRSSW